MTAFNTSREIPATALVFMLAGAAIVMGDRAQMPAPQGALVPALVVAALGLGYRFTVLRLLRAGSPIQLEEG